MFLIKCPWCGERAETEFTYKGDANIKRPDPQNSTDDEWLNHIYFRKNPKGTHNEFWQHTSGCRQFFKVQRNLITHEILATGKPAGNLDGNE